MRRLLLVFTALSLLAGTDSAQAQFGRIRDAARDAAGGRQKQPEPVTMVVVPFTDDVISGYLRGLAAQQAEMQRLARRNDEVGRYYAALLEQQAIQRRRNEFNAETGPDWAEHQRLTALARQGDRAAITALAELTSSLKANRTLPEIDWNAQRDATRRLDSLSILGSGMGAGEWMYVSDKLPALAGQLMTWVPEGDSGLRDFARANIVRPAEVLAVKARRIELARALAWEYRTDEQIARGEAETQALEEQDPSTHPDPNVRYSHCMDTEMKPLAEEARRREAEFEAARASGNLTPILEFGQRLGMAQAAAIQKCTPILEGN